MSAPLVKYSPAPVRITASTDSLRSAVSRSAAKRENTALLKEFFDYSSMTEEPQIGGGGFRVGGQEGGTYMRETEG